MKFILCILFTCWDFDWCKIFKSKRKK